jgi:trigger factor
VWGFESPRPYKNNEAPFRGRNSRDMHIEREETGTLTATLKVKLVPEDYSPGVEKALKEQRRNAVLPGFRPGQVPMTLIRKRVGKAVLISEVERLIDENLRAYLQENAIRVLGQPLPRHDGQDSHNWDQPGEFTFSYELGMAPVFDVELSEKIGVDYPVVDVADDLVQREIEDMQRRFGRVETAEVSGDKDMLLGDLIELNADGSIKEGGIMNRATMSLEFIPDEGARASLTGLQVGSEVVVDPHKVSRGHEDLARMLGIDQEAVASITGDFLFRVVEVKRMVPVELGPELFGRVYGVGAVIDEADFRKKVKEGMENMFRRDSDRIYKRLVMRKLQESARFELPDTFLKRWIQETSREPITPEQVEEGYTQYADGLKRQLVEDRVIEKYGLEAKGEEMDAFARRYVVDQFMQYGMPEPEPEQVQQMAARILGDREQLGRIRNTIVEQKLMVHFRTLLSPPEKRMSYDEFVNLARTA